MLYYEPDDGSDHFWPVVFHYAKSLRSLSVHTPPQYDGSRVWTPATAGRVVAELTGLEYLEVDIPLEEAEGLVSVDDNGIATSCAGDGSSGIVDEVAKMTRLKVATRQCLVGGRSKLVCGGVHLGRDGGYLFSGTEKGSL